MLNVYLGGNLWIRWSLIKEETFWRLINRLLLAASFCRPESFCDKMSQSDVIRPLPGLIKMSLARDISKVVCFRFPDSASGRCLVRPRHLGVGTLIKPKTLIEFKAQASGNHWITESDYRD